MGSAMGPRNASGNGTGNGTVPGAWRRFRAGIARMWREWPFWRDLGVDWSGRPAVRPARNSIGALLRLFGPRWPAVLWVALNVVFGASLGVLPPLYVRNILDQALPHHDPALLWSDALHLVAVQVLVGLTAAVGGYLYAWATNGVVRDLRQGAFERLQGAPLARLEAGGGAEAASRLVNDVGVVGGNSAVFNGVTGIFSSMLATLGAVTTLVSTLIVMFTLNWRFALIALAFLPPLLLLARLAGRWLYAVTRRQYELLAAFHRRIGRAAHWAGALTLRLFHRDAADLQAFTRENAALADLGTCARNIVRGYGNVYAVAPALALALIWWFGAHAIFRGAMQLGTLLAFVAYVQRITGPVSTLSGVFINVRGIQAVGDRVEGVAATGDEPGPAAEPEVSSRPGAARGDPAALAAAARPGRPLWVVAPWADERRRLRGALLAARQVGADPAGPARPVVAGVGRAGVLWGRTLADHLGAPRGGPAVGAALRGAGLEDWVAGLTEGLQTPLADVHPTPEQEFRLSLAAALIRGADLLVVDATDPATPEVDWAGLPCGALLLAAAGVQVPAGVPTRLWDPAAAQGGAPVADAARVPTAASEPAGGAAPLQVVEGGEPLPGWWSRARGGLRGWWRLLGVQVRLWPPVGRGASLRRLVRYYYPYWPYWIFVVLMALIAIGGLSQIAPLFTRLMIDQALPHKNIHLLLLGIAMGVLAPPLVHVFTGTISTITHETMSNRALRDMRQEAYTRASRWPLGFYRRHAPHEVLSRLVNDVNSVYLGAADIANASWMLLPLLPAVAIMLGLNARLALLILLGLVPTAALSYILGQVRYPLTRRTFEVVSALNGQLARTCSPEGALAVRGAGAEPIERAAFAAHNRLLASLGLTAGTVQVVFAFVVACVGALVAGALYWQGGLAVLAGRMSVGTLVAMATYVVAMEHLHGGFQIYMDLRSVQANCDRIFAYMDADPTPGPAAGDSPPPPRVDQAPVTIRNGLPGGPATTVPVGGQRRLTLPAGVPALEQAAVITGLWDASLGLEIAGAPLPPGARAGWRQAVAVLSAAFPVGGGETYADLIGPGDPDALATALRRVGLPPRPEEPVDPDAPGALRFRLSVAAALLRPEAWFWIVDEGTACDDLPLAELAGGRSVLYLGAAADPRQPEATPWAQAAAT